MEKKLSYLSMKPHLKQLRFFGFYPLDKEAPKLHKMFHTVYMRLSLVWLPMVLLQQFYQIYKVRDDSNKVVEILLMLLTYLGEMYKQNVFWLKADRINVLIDVMKGPRFNQGVKDHEALLTSNMRFSRRFLRTFNIAGFITTTIWIIYRFLMFHLDNTAELPYWFPFDAYNKRSSFYLAALYAWVHWSWAAFNNTTMDSFISFCLAQSKTQLSIIRLDLEKIIENSKQEAKVNSTSFYSVLQRRFRDILLHYNETVNFTDNFQRIFGGAVLFQFMLSGWVICLTAYRTVMVPPLSIDFASLILYMACIVAELYLYCYFGNEVNWESALVLESAYTMDWLEFPLHLRKHLIIFMERLKRPLLPRAGSFIPLSNSTFITIMRSSYSFYVLLKNSNQRKLDLEKIIENSKQEAKVNSTSFYSVLQRRFRDILLHYNETVNFTDNFQRIFGGAVLFQFMLSGWVICLTAYRTVMVPPLSIDFASLILYMACIVAELYLYCYFGNEVNWESALVLESAYTMDWLEFPLHLRKHLIIFMERLKRPLLPRAGSFIPLSNSTFITIMRSSYSFYVLLKNSNQRK